MTDAAVIGPVVLRLPPDPALSRVLRLAASGVAAMAGFTVDETEDIKIAVSEVLLALIEHGAGKSIEVQFVVQNHSFTGVSCGSGRTMFSSGRCRAADVILPL